ncbi:MAG: hypothetical protein HOO06_09530 [Bdellovibrionaceae bacterium]|jgi:hypothetical protein|nr:hypothetical protein [Pseudobdellovibrionaceae bacterium]
MKRKKNHRFWRHYFKRKFRQVRYFLFEAQINEKRLEEIKQQGLEMQIRSGYWPHL